MAENINLGAVQAPYWEHIITLQPGETRKIDYVYDSFNLLSASINNVLEVTFGGAAVQSKFSAGMGFKLSQPVGYIQFFNTSNQELTIDFSLAIGSITDNRLTVSGVVDMRAVEPVSIRPDKFTNYAAGHATAPTPFTWQAKAEVRLVVVSGTIVLNYQAADVQITDLNLTSGMVWGTYFENAGSMGITGDGVFIWEVGVY